MLFVLNEHHSVANQFLLELRDRQLQKDRLRFRKNMERLGEIMAYEISKKLDYAPQPITTPLGSATLSISSDQPVLVTILRAGLGYFQGFLNFFDQADCGFVGAYRQEDGNNITIKLSYVATQSLENKIVLLIDPMLATGRSIIDTVQAILKNGKPKHIHIASLVSAPEGIEYLKEHMTISYSLWTCAIDTHLDENFYIVPGLGDAGDLSYGIKL
jgi:uracil phosphoribosyltransferase